MRRMRVLRMQVLLNKGCQALPVFIQYCLCNITHERSFHLPDLYFMQLDALGLD